MLTGFITATRAIARAFVIFAAVLFATLRWGLGALALVVTFQPLERRRAWFGRCLADLFRWLGATFVKVGQIMSTRPDLLPPHVIRALETLQDDVGPFAYRHVRRTFVEDFGQPPEAIFKSFAERPIASASVAQVHRATLPDGREVAVKVRRPRIEATVAFDLKVMRMAARLIGLWPSWRLLAPVESVNEFGRGIELQLDFTVEARNNRRFRKSFAGDPDLRFPALVDELCSKRVLTMDFIDGQKVLQAEASVEGKRRLAAVGFRMLFKMIFEDGFVHADLHPGNILVGKDGQVAVLDLGLVGELDDRHRNGFARYFAAWSLGDGKTMARIMTSLSPSKEIPDYEGFEEAVCGFVSRYHGKRLGEVEVSGVLFDMLGILRKYRVRANPTFTLVNIAICVTEGIGKQLDPEVDLISTALPYFARFDFFRNNTPTAA